jgi:exo-beta-1,3-glucanase (GH17 family)
MPDSLKIFPRLNTMFLYFKQLPRVALALLFSVLMVGCGGGGAVDTAVSKRALSADFSSRKAVNYSPYRDAARNAALITDANVLQDLNLLVAGNFKLIRLFDSSDEVAKRVLRLIRDNSLDIKVMLGIWIAKDNETFNQAEIARGVALAATYRDTVLAVSVGNETMVSWQFANNISVAQMAGYLTKVRAQITQPITTDDNWAFFAQTSGEKNPRAIIDLVDFVAMHTYPLAETIAPAIATWDYRQYGVPAGNARAVAMMDASIAAAKTQYTSVRSKLDALGFTGMPIMIGETGWKASASNGESHRTHPVNQKMYLERLMTWRSQVQSTGLGPFAIFYFQAFDEPWKNSDDQWGLFNVSRQARYAIKDLYPVASGFTHETGTSAYTDADALYMPDVSNTVVTGSRYTVYADAITVGETRADITAAYWYGWDHRGWDNPATAFAGEATGGTGELASFMEIGPSPKVWGWGMLAAPGAGNVITDLSEFATTGYLNFDIKTLYPGKIEVGFNPGGDIYLTLDPSLTNVYGYHNDGTWRTVRIPISAIVAAGIAKGASTPNLTQVNHPFVIADRYSTTGKAQGFGNTTKIYVDNIYWSK